MKVFLAFVKKEFFHIMRDKRTLLILFGMPIVQVLLFGYAVTNDFKGAAIAIYDQSKDELTSELVRELEAGGNFEIVQNLESQKAIDAAFKKGTIKMAVIFPPDFSSRFYKENDAPVQLIADGTEPNTATMLISYATVIIRQFQQKKLPVAPIPFAINIETQMVYNPELKSVYMFVPGVMTTILLLISAMMTSLTLAKEKELGTMELLLVSPLHPLIIIIGKVTPYIFLSMAISFFILAMGVFIFGVPIMGSIFLLTMLSLLFILTSLALGIFISSRTDNQQTAMLTSLMALMMPSMLLSGFIFPIESMPMPLQIFSYIIPAKYFIIILKDIMLKGSGLAFIWAEVVSLVVITVIFLALSLKNFKIRVE